MGELRELVEMYADVLEALTSTKDPIQVQELENRRQELHKKISEKMGCKRWPLSFNWWDSGNQYAKRRFIEETMRRARIPQTGIKNAD